MMYHVSMYLNFKEKYIELFYSNIVVPSIIEKLIETLYYIYTLDLGTKILFNKNKNYNR